MRVWNLLEWNHNKIITAKITIIVKIKHKDPLTVCDTLKSNSWNLLSKHNSWIGTKFQDTKTELTSLWPQAENFLLIAVTTHNIQLSLHLLIFSMHAVHILQEVLEKKEQMLQTITCDMQIISIFFSDQMRQTYGLGNSIVN